MIGSIAQAQFIKNYEVIYEKKINMEKYRSNNMPWSWEIQGHELSIKK